MAKRKQQPATELIVLEVEDYSAYTSYHFNWDVQQKNRRYPETKVFSISLSVELQCRAVYSDTRQGNAFDVHLFHSPEGREALTLGDCVVRNKDGSPSYRTIRGFREPQYRLPTGVAVIEKARGNDRWSSFVQLPDGQMAFVMQMLHCSKPVYVSFHEMRENRRRWMLQFEMSHRHPDD